MSTRRVGDLVVVAHNTEAPNDAAWEEFLSFFREASDVGKTRVLVFTDGGAPNTLQRASLNSALGGKQPRIAVVSASRLVRGVATAISWFNPNIDIFTPDHVEKALDHLNVPAAERRGLLEIGATLRAQVSSARAASH